MNLDNIQFTVPSTSSLTLGYYVPQEDWNYIKSDIEVQNFPFGNSDKDLFDLSVFTLDGTHLTGSLIKPSGSYQSFTGSYYNAVNVPVTYNHEYYSSTFVVVGEATQSVMIDLSQELASMSINDGNYKIGIQLIRDLVGSSFDTSQRLMIDQISPSRTEIFLIPISLRTSTNKKDVQLYSEFEAFGQDKLQVKEVLNQLISGIKSPELYNLYYTAKKENPEGANGFLFYYGFKKDVDAIKFVEAMYYGVRKQNMPTYGVYNRDILGIYDQFYNWLHENYTTIISFQELRDVYYSFFSFIVQKELNAINGRKPDSFDAIVSFLSTIYYTLAFYPKIAKVEESYNNFVFGYFKNYLNFGDGTLLPIMNKKLVASADEVNHDRLAIKLQSPLDNSITTGTKLWISNLFASQPIVQNTYYFTKSGTKTIRLRGPNLTVKLENEGNSTETLSSSELLGETGSLYNELSSKLVSKNVTAFLDTVDYRYFENFVTFSSAQARLDVYTEKAAEIDSLEKAISDLNIKLSLQPNDQYYSKEKSEANNRIDEIKASFDGYENFLSRNPSWYQEHLNAYDGVSSASLYDQDNNNSLVNGLPEFISSGEDNGDYVKFVEMIGHYFDNLSLFIKQFTEKNNHTNATGSGVSLSITADMLRSLGWEPEISKENLPLLLSSFSKADFSPSSSFYNKVGSMSETERNQIIWKRLLNSLPFIYKTKGTEASINAIISCFGIPKNLIKIKEYGGISSLLDSSDKSYYIFDNIKYEPYFSGSGEYFQASWTGSIQTVEFNVSFDEDKINEENTVFYIAGCTGIWNIGAIRDRGKQWGRLFFTINDGSLDRTVATSKMPIFDGKTYTVMLRRKNPLPGFNLDGQPDSVVDLYPIEYELLAKRAEDSRIVYSSSGSIVLSGSFNTTFRTGTNILFGDNWAGTTGSFWGSIDEIKLWEIPLEESRFDHHVLYRGSYDSSTPQEMVEKNLLHISFERPIDLSLSGSVMTLNNLSFRSDFPTFEAHDFQPVYGISYDEYGCPYSASLFPYQFLQKNTKQTIQIPSYGASRFRSNKINYVEQVMTSPLSSESRSTMFLSSVNGKDSNKLGVFFSPIDMQNEEILKFFGSFEIGDLIGDPRTVYDATYKKFEKFREIYYEQGLGNVDYQTFMNMVKSYFDKSMFNYIKTVVPARTKLAQGLLLEPTILERPKLELKPVVRENVTVWTGSAAYMGYGITGSQNTYYTQSINIGERGTSLLNDVNHMLYVDVPDKYGVGIYSDEGITYYSGDYYRVDKIKKTKTYQIKRKYALSGSQLNEFEKSVDFNGTVQTVSRSYYEISLSKLPTVSEFSLYIVNPTVTMSFSGSISFDIGANGNTSSLQTTSHTINGILWDGITGTQHNDNPLNGPKQIGRILVPIQISASFIPGTNGAALYSGDFSSNFDATKFYFSGSITVPSFPFPNNEGYFDTTFYAANPTASIFDEFIYKTYGALFGTANSGVKYRSLISLSNQPSGSFFQGYFETHYKYKKKVFSQKEINSFDQNNNPQKWKRGSQNRKTTVDESTGLLNNTFPVETKAT